MFSLGTRTERSGSQHSHAKKQRSHQGTKPRIDHPGAILSTNLTNHNQPCKQEPTVKLGLTRYVVYLPRLQALHGTTEPLQQLRVLEDYVTRCRV